MLAVAAPACIERTDRNCSLVWRDILFDRIAEIEREQLSSSPLTKAAGDEEKDWRAAGAADSDRRGASLGGPRYDSPWSGGRKHAAYIFKMGAPITVPSTFRKSGAVNFRLWVEPSFHGLESLLLLVCTALFHISSSEMTKLISHSRLETLLARLHKRSADHRRWLNTFTLLRTIGSPTLNGEDIE